MKIPKRQIHHYLWDPEIVGDRMIFLSGPRQVGKTSYAKEVLKSRKEGAYFNWDNPLVRREYAKDPFFFLKQRRGKANYLVVFDEIHKRLKWKDILKGLFDSIERNIQIFVTGSSRLEWFRKSGDSLVGRYSHFHMLPLSLSEVLDRPFFSHWLTSPKDWEDPRKYFFRKIEGRKTLKEEREALEHLLTFGGFPEPFARGSDRFLRKWKEDYLSLILKEDLREISNIRSVDIAESFMTLLPPHVGNPLSLNTMARDLEVSFPTVKNHLLQLEKLWLLFSMRPWSRSLKRVLKKEKKVYFTNWTYCSNPGAVFENFIALSLLRASHIWNDMGMGKTEIYFVRNFDGGEVDFLLAINNAPALLIEAKVSQVTMDKASVRFSQELKIPVVQVVNRPHIYNKRNDRIIVSAERFLSVLP